ncbi:hypothetical protein FXO37_23611 [Capsicum annuum]|nr:hypothetical protein FXO37_23611 [Capsicum annuum]
MCQNGHNDKNSHLRVTLNNILGLEDSDSLLHNDNENDEKSYGGYVDGPDRHLDSNDEDFQNMVDEEMNRSHQSDEEESLSVFDCKEYDHQDHGTKEDEGTMHDDGYTDAQYTAGPIIGISFRSVQFSFIFYKEPSRLTGFGIIKKKSKKMIK